MAEDVKKDKEFEEEVEDVEEEVEDIEEDEEDSKKNNGKSEKKERTFTQAEVNRMMTREKRQGKRSVYESLGIDPKDEKTVSMFKAFVKSQKSEEQLEQERQNEAATKLREAESRAMAAELKAEVMMAGVNRQYVEDAIVLISAKMSEDSDTKSLIGELKTKYPTWFDDGEDSDENKRRRGTGSSLKDKASSKTKTKGNENEEKSFGARLAAQRKNPVKKSYWS